jgi:hypothetical protein
LVARLGGDLHSIEPEALARLPEGLPISVLRERGSDQLFLLLAGRKVQVELGLPVAEVDGLELDGLRTATPALEWRPVRASGAVAVGEKIATTDRVASPPGVFACVVDAEPRFHLDALRWYAALTRVAGVDPADLVIHAVSGTTSEALDWLRRQGVSIRAVEPFDGRAPYCNKISGALCLAAAGVAGAAVLTDADVAICEDPRVIRVAPGALAMKVVDAENPPLDVLRRVFDTAGLELPPLVAPDFFPERRTAATNGNGGLYVVRGSLLSRIAGAWEFWARWLLERSHSLGVLKHADQMAMALALAEAGFETLHLDLRWNLPTHHREWIGDEVETPAVLHYHDRVEPSGMLSVFGVEAVDERIRAVNVAIAEVLALALPEQAGALSQA